MRYFGTMTLVAEGRTAAVSIREPIDLGNADMLGGGMKLEGAMAR